MWPIRYRPGRGAATSRAGRCRWWQPTPASASTHPEMSLLMDEFFEKYGYWKYMRLDKGVGYLWEGGQYVGVYWSDHLAINGRHESTPFIVVNVKNMDGTLRVSDYASFTAECDAWLAENESELGHY